VNQGTQPTSAADIEQQNIANQQLQDFSKTEMPALGYEIKTLKNDEGAKEQMASGEMAGTARKAEGQALQGAAQSDSNRLALPGSGSAVSRQAGILTRGAAGIGSGVSRGSLAARGASYGEQAGIIGQGNQLLEKANRGLITDGGVTDAINNAKTASDTQSHQEAATLSTSALAALA